MNPEQQAGAATTWPDAQRSHDDRAADSAGAIRQHWERIQASFVDDPQGAVVQAEELANQLIAQVRERLERERAGIVRGHAEGASTEDLRMCVKRYRELVDRLLAMTG